MNRTTLKHQDWTITATCRKHSPHDVSGPGRYSGHAIAVLADHENEYRWSDPRPQTAHVVGRTYASSEACLAALVAEVTHRIHLLERGERRSPVISGQAASHFPP